MNKWYNWLVMAAIFAFAGIANYFDEKTIIGNIIQVILFVFLALSQFVCDKHGEKGKRIFRYIEKCLTIIIVIFIVVLIYKAIG